MAVVTDARFSGVSTGACIGHVGPEALAGGPIGKLRDGDRIQIIIDRNRLEGSIDLVGEGTPAFTEEVGIVSWRNANRVRLGGRPEPTRRHQAVGGLQRAGGGVWGGCVYDVDAIVAKMEMDGCGK